MKIKMFLSRVWNIWDLLAIAIFAFGAGFRFCSRVKDAHLLYAVDVVLWNMRILELMSVNQYLGPYVKIIAKLVSACVMCLHCSLKVVLQNCKCRLFCINDGLCFFDHLVLT